MSAASFSNPTKFDFGETFDDIVGGDYAQSQEKERLWTEEEVEEERAIALKQGIEKGRAQAMSSIEQRISQSNSVIIKQVTEITQQLEATSDALKGEACTLALTVGRKLGSALLAQAREREIEALVSEALALLPGQPHVVIRVNDALLDGFRKRFQSIADECGYQGKLILLGEPDLAETDCQIEWADGGMRRDVANLDAEIDTIVRRHLGAPPLPDPSMVEPYGPDAEQTHKEEG